MDLESSADVKKDMFIEPRLWESFSFVRPQLIEKGASVRFDAGYEYCVHHHPKLLEREIEGMTLFAVAEMSVADENKRNTGVERLKSEMKELVSNSPFRSIIQAGRDVFNFVFRPHIFLDEYTDAMITQSQVGYSTCSDKKQAYDILYAYKRFCRKAEKG